MPTSRFTAVLSWDAEPTGGAEHGTWGELTIALDGVPLWGARESSRLRGVRWTWVDLLEHLAEVWPWLLLEEGWPRPTATTEDERFEHRYRHDLAMAIRGKVLPPLWIVREGQHAWVGDETAPTRLGFEEVEAVLRLLGDRIAERLARIDDERARDAVLAWVSRPQSGAPGHEDEPAPSNGSDCTHSRRRSHENMLSQNTSMGAPMRSDSNHPVRCV